jgi:hypothetical protein
MLSVRGSGDHLDAAPFDGQLANLKIRTSLVSLGGPICQRGRGSNEVVIYVVFADPKPDIIVLVLRGESAIFARYASGPNFPPAPVGHLFELEGRMAGVCFQQRELLIRPLADVGGKARYSFQKSAVVACIVRTG